MKKEFDHCASIQTNRCHFTDRSHMIDYIFRVVLPKYGYSVRESQITLSKQMCTALSNYQISLSEAEVGTGKTFAYLVACVVNADFKPDDRWARMNYCHSYHFTLSTPMPYVIATSNIALQKAILSDYIPRLSSILLTEGLITQPLTGVLRKGKSNYICDIKLYNYIRDLEHTNKPRRELNALKKLIHGRGIDLDRVDSITRYDKRHIAVSGCSHSCEYYGVCRYHTMQRAALLPHHFFQVCNHHYYVADIMHRKQNMHHLLPNYRGVIVDESHKLSDVLVHMYGKKINQHDVLNLLTQSVRTLKNTPSYAHAKFLKKQIKKQINALFDDLAVSSDDTDAIDCCVLDKEQVIHLKLIANYFNQLSHLIKSAYPKQKPYVYAIKALRSRIMEFLSSDHPIVHLPIDGKHAYPALCTLPIDINQLYKQHVWNKSLPIILTSGTLSINDEFDYAKKTLGLESLPFNKVTTTRQPSPFDYQNNCMLYISENTVFPNKKNPKYIQSIAEEIIQLIQATQGRTLILFTSYSVLNDVFVYIKDKVEYPLIVSERGRRNAVDLFKQTNNGVLLSTDAWEGVDIEGDLLSSLIITKLPFPIPSAVHQLTHGQAFAESNVSIINPTMLVKLKQGFGRLIRTETDEGVCSILDSRASIRGKYREAVLSTLPTCRMANDIDDVAKFITARDYSLSLLEGGIL